MLNFGWDAFQKSAPPQALIDFMEFYAINGQIILCFVTFSFLVWTSGRLLSRPFGDLIARRAPRLDRSLHNYPIARRRLHRTLGGSIALLIWYVDLAVHAERIWRGPQKGDYVKDVGWWCIWFIVRTFVETGVGMWVVARGLRIWERKGWRSGDDGDGLSV